MYVHSSGMAFNAYAYRCHNISDIYNIQLRQHTIDVRNGCNTTCTGSVPLRPSSLPPVLRRASALRSLFYPFCVLFSDRHRHGNAQMVRADNLKVLTSSFGISMNSRQFDKMSLCSLRICSRPSWTSEKITNQAIMPTMAILT